MSQQIIYQCDVCKKKFNICKPGWVIRLGRRENVERGQGEWTLDVCNQCIEGVMEIFGRKIK